MSSLYSHLQTVYGFQKFRPYQEPVVRAILDGQDSFTIMPTGGGKSLCYQLPARILSGVCIVVSPLISLMKDQVDAAQAQGLCAATLNSASSTAERNAVWRGLQDHSLDLLYVSPERLALPDFLDTLKRAPLSFFAIDEAHCISSWGHDFRPDYLALSQLIREFPHTPIAAFTATATAKVAQDIVDRLGLRNPFCTKASFNRPNLFYQTMPRTDLDAQLLAFLREHKDESGIIYHTTRKDVERTAEFLSKQGIAAMPYHAGLPDAQRSAAQDAFRLDTCQIIVATIAFGMGIDKPNVRFVVHADLPKNLEGYYQETGRAGRDGDDAHCLLLYSRKDIGRHMGLAAAIPNTDMREAAKQQLWRMLEFTQVGGCRRKALLAYFGEVMEGENCGACDICTGAAQQEDATIPAQKLLSAMVRTGCRFGARHVISIVMGKETEKICSLGHQLLPTFGVGKEETARYWRAMVDVLMAQGLVHVADAQFPIPVVTELGWQVLRGQRQVYALVQAKSSRSSRQQEELSPLYMFLRDARSALAQEKGVAPYVILHDRALREMAHAKPDAPEKMLSIAGIGQHKMQTYGKIFASIIGDYLAQYPEETPTRAPVPVFTADPGEGRAKREKGDSWRETGRLLEEGLDIPAICEARKLKIATILSHLEHLLEEGNSYAPERFMELSRLEELRPLFAATEGWALGPVVELAQERGIACTFEDARLARMFLSTP